MNRRRDVAAIGVAALSLWAATAACSGSGGSGSGGGGDDGERGLVGELDPIVPPRPAPVDLDALESPSDCAQAGDVRRRSGLRGRAHLHGHGDLARLRSAVTGSGGRRPERPQSASSMKRRIFSLKTR